MKVDEFFLYARQRYLVKLHKDNGEPAPWTDDPILQQYRFCNVFREDDKVTTWFRENIRNHLTTPQEQLFGTLLFRWFNLIETGKVMIATSGPREIFNPKYWDKCKGTFEYLMKSQPRKISGAYMIKSPTGMDKVAGLIWCLDQIAPHAYHLAQIMDQPKYTLENATKALMQYPFIGAFMAYEVVTDLRHTPLLSDAPDIMTWANPGPGAARGLCRLLGESLNFLNRNNASHVATMMDLMRLLLAASTDTNNWPDFWPKWEMRDVEHTLCEFDKYERARLGEGSPKQKYKGV